MLPGYIVDEAYTAGEVVYNQALDRQSMSWVVTGEFHLYLWKEAGVAVLGRRTTRALTHLRKPRASYLSRDFDDLMNFLMNEVK